MTLACSSLTSSLGSSFESTPQVLRTYGATAPKYCAVAQNYDVARPDYRKEDIAELLKDLGVKKESTVVDLGAGSGKLTKALLKHWYPNQDPKSVQIDNLFAIELAADMREKFSERFPNIKIFGGFAEDTRVLQDGAVDCVIVGTAYHWFKPEASEEIYRILKHHGKLGLIWNMLNPEIEWVKKCRDRLEPPGTANNHDTGKWKEQFKDNILFSNPFRNHKTRRYTLQGSEDDVILCLQSFSAYTNFSEEEKEAFVRDVREILADVPRTAEGKIDVPFRVEMYWCKKQIKVMKRSEEKLPALKTLIPRTFSDLAKESRDSTDECEGGEILISTSITGDLRKSESEDDEAMGSPLKSTSKASSIAASVLAESELAEVDEKAANDEEMRLKNEHAKRKLFCDDLEGVKTSDAALKDAGKKYPAKRHKLLPTTFNLNKSNDGGTEHM